MALTKYFWNLAISCEDSDIYVERFGNLSEIFYAALENAIDVLMQW